MTREQSAFTEVVRIVAPLLILAIGGGGYLMLEGRREVTVRPAEEKQAPLVDTASVVPYTETLTIEVDGQVVPYLEVSLSAEVAGSVTEKAEVCRAGKFVRTGELLIQIDQADYLLAEERLTEERVQAEVALKERDVEDADTQSLVELAEEDLELREADLARYKELLTTRAVSEAGVDEAKMSVIQAKNNLMSLKKQLNLLKAKEPRLTSATKLIDIQLKQAELDLARTTITSPIDGMVVVESVEEDSYVQKGTPLVTIEETSAVEVRCNLRMDELCWIWSQVEGRESPEPDTSAQLEYQIPETPVTVSYRLAGQEYTWDGVLWRYDGIGLDERTRTVPCRVLVNAPRDVSVRTPVGRMEPSGGPPALVRGMFVNMEIHTQPKTDLLKVPEVAVQPGNRVWRVRDSRLHTVDVHVVEIDGGSAVLRVDANLLSAGDAVVVSPLAEAIDGMIVRQRSEGAGLRAEVEEVALATEESTR